MKSNSESPGQSTGQKNDILFGCSTCAKRMSIAREYAGKTIKCRQCGELTRIPATSDDQTTAKVPRDAKTGRPIGGIKDCPRCGGIQLRDLSTAETREFYDEHGVNPLVTVHPKKCLKCNHAWETTKPLSERLDAVPGVPETKSAVRLAMNGCAVLSIVVGAGVLLSGFLVLNRPRWSTTPASARFAIGLQSVLVGTGFYYWQRWLRNRSERAKANQAFLRRNS
jgi:uncharacterized metal-binding protein